MKLFELHQKEARLTHLNTRLEKFGNDGDRLACDLEIEFTTSNDWLNEIKLGLKQALYAPPEKPDLADGGEEHMPVLRFPEFGTLEWEAGWVNCRFVIHRGIKESSNLIFEDCKINRLRFIPKDGGSIIVKYRVQMNPDPEKPAIIGQLGVLLTNKTVMVSMSRPLDSETPMATNTPEPNPLERRAANDEPDGDDDADHPGNPAPAPARAGRGRGRG